MDKKLLERVKNLIDEGFSGEQIGVKIGHSRHYVRTHTKKSLGEEYVRKLTDNGKASRARARKYARTFGTMYGR